MSARAVACEVVRRTFEEDAYTDRAFRAEAERAELDGEPVTVWRARAGSGGGEPGTIYAPLRIGCGEGVLEVLELQPAGRRRLAVADYLRGLRRAPERAA